MAQVHNIADNAALVALLAGATLADGHTIKLAGGEYALSASIIKGVTITRGDGVDLADISITGQWTINSVASVTIDGLRFVNKTTPAVNSDQFNSLKIKTSVDGDHTVINSEFVRDGVASVATNPLHYAIFLEGPGANSIVSIEGNEFHSTSTGSLYGPGVWRAGIWAPSVNNGQVVIEGNDFHDLRAGMSIGSFDSDWSITGNDFQRVATGISFGNQFSGTISNITGNSFGDGIDSEFNFSGTASGVTFTDASQFNATDGVYVLGGSGIDTIQYDGDISSLQSFTKWDSDGAGWLINYTGPTTFGTPQDMIAALVDEDMVVKVEKIVADNGTYLLVGSGGYATITAALAAAQAGDTIRIASGTYAESVVIDKANLTIIGDGDATVIQGTGGNGSKGIEIKASGVTLQDIKLSNFHYNVRVTADANDLVIDDVTFSGGKIGVGKSTETDILGLTIKDSTFENLTIGVDLPTAQAQGRVAGFDVLDSKFESIRFKGIYAEALTDALIDGVNMRDVGQFGDDVGANGNGIDINLKYGAYSDITIRDFVLEDVGGSLGSGGAPHANGAAIAVKARNDGNYASSPASFTGEVVIENGSITGAAYGIRVGEAGKTVGGPAAKISDVSVGSSIADLVNVTTATVKIDADANYSTDGSTGYINDGVPDVLTVGAGGYATIAAALAAAHEGDVIKLTAGEYAETVTISKGVKIEGAANHASVIKSAWTIATTEQVTVGGLNFLDDRAYTLDINDNYVALKVLQHSTAPGGHTIKDSIFDRDPASDPGGFNPSAFAGSNAQPTHRAIEISSVGAGAEITIEGNTFTGGNSYPYAGDNWRSAIYSNGGAGETNITDNTFENVRSAINADNFSDRVQITDNSFHDLGTGISIGVGSDASSVTTITGNEFGANIPDAFNFQNVTTAIGFDPAANSFGAGTTVRIPYGAANDAIGVTAGADVIDGNAGVDTVDYGAQSITSLTKTAGGWNVTSSAGAFGAIDKLTDIEIIEHAGGRTLLVGGDGGGFATIGAAIAAAQTNDKIVVAAGVYTENVVVNKAGVTIEGLGDVTIKGTFNASNGGFSGNLSDWIGPQVSYNGASSYGVTIAASGVTLKNLNIDDFYQGVRFASDVNNTSLTDVDIENSLFGLHKTMDADVVGLTITRGSIVDGYQGTDFTKSTTSLTDGQLKDVTITGTLFKDLSAKGIYTEALANAVITGITMNNVGVYGRGDSFGDIGQHGAGIDINLKSGAYSGITIRDFTFTNVGTSNGAGSSHNNAGAITIKARDDAPSYNANAATFTGAVIVRDGVINGTSTGVRVGEEGKRVTGPEVDVINVQVTGYVNNADHGAFINDTTTQMDVSSTRAGFVFSNGTGSGQIRFSPFVVTPEPEDPTPPPPPPPPNPGQGPGTQTPEQQVETGFGVSTGVDPTSEKATQPTITLPSGQEIANPVYEQARQLTDLAAQFKAGTITETVVIDKMVEFATETTAVALQAYQFFTGATPTQEGVAYLVNSDDNDNDLTDPYYATFSPDNRYINFAVSLGTGGQGSQDFAQEYGAMSFEDSIRSAYDKIIGVDEARAAGVDVNAAVAYVLAQLAYFTALGGSAIGAKAAMVGYLMYAGMQAKIGVYYEGTRGFLTNAFHGDAEYNVDLTGGSSGLTSAHLDFGLA